MVYSHEPVMLKQALAILGPKAGDNYFDGTLGGAGYTLTIARLIKPGKIISTDLDQLAIRHAKQLIKASGLKNIILVQDNFKNISAIVRDKLPGEKFAGIVLDLGLSSAQLEDEERGFSFQTDRALDMAFGESTISTFDIVNHWPQSKLEKIIRDYGEERFAAYIAKNICQTRERYAIKTTGELVEVISRAVPKKFQFGRIHFATKTFQALRIATNDELNSLQEFLPHALSILKPGGRLVIISFHSLEDRIAKQFFLAESKDCHCPPKTPICVCHHLAKIKLITKKPLTAGPEEIAANPRSRSAKLRAAELIKN